MTRELLCPFCGLHPYEYVDIGVGSQAVAVNCCEDGQRLYAEGEDFTVLATAWMAGARTSIERYQKALREIAFDTLSDAPTLREIAREALYGPRIQEPIGDGFDLF